MDETTKALLEGQLINWSQILYIGAPIFLAIVSLSLYIVKLHKELKSIMKEDIKNSTIAINNNTKLFEKILEKISK